MKYKLFKEYLKCLSIKYLKDNPKSNITNEMVSMSKKLRPENWKNKEYGVSQEVKLKKGNTQLLMLLKID